jgi:hypothetical protein
MRTEVAGPRTAGQRGSGISGGPDGGRGGITLPVANSGAGQVSIGLKGPRKRRKTMSRETTNAGKLGRLQKLSTALAANSGDLQHLQGSITQLATLLTQAQEAAKQQAAFMAGKQEASKQLNTFVIEGERLATVLQLAVKQPGQRQLKKTSFRSRTGGLQNDHGGFRNDSVSFHRRR